MVGKKYWYVMYYITYQTLNLPPPGIELGSPASQIGTLPKELSDNIYQHCGSGMFIPNPRSQIRLFSIPDPGSDLSPFRITDPHQRI